MNGKVSLPDQSKAAAIDPAGLNEEIFHIQADGFFGPEKGFEDVEQLRKQQPH